MIERGSKFRNRFFVVVDVDDAAFVFCANIFLLNFSPRVY